MSTPAVLRQVGLDPSNPYSTETYSQILIDLNGSCAETWRQSEQNQTRDMAYNCAAGYTGVMCLDCKRVAGSAGPHGFRGPHWLPLGRMHAQPSAQALVRRCHAAPTHQCLRIQRAWRRMRRGTC